ncbi:peptide-methionine (S)-S-oxide reductase MsrA [Rhodopirellula halodulae]|uniref:peptide-methionine (S)-S-oxide reductase MsrA n=1 Tax=Rhodopirellula halodulae TaxID=2894198 RepID=UPI001E32DFB5|nr:peptide-methionine (S)-S-oxide reductase MsrA [Rhodopirellula sp. JC737]MCC9656066.1 peptide-methionine (S)-S-oxide reductase MsrA [Rhodopirellula sp. JC737]
MPVSSIQTLFSRSLASFAAIGMMAISVSCSQAAPPQNQSSDPNANPNYNGLPLDSEIVDVKTRSGEKIATLAGGCFWCTEAVFERMEGINDVVSGYIGGKVPNPNYEQVCGKKTGHAEAVQVYYDPEKTNYEEILEVFFKTHDPTTLNRQGADAGPQYRSSVFVHNDEQREIAKKVIEKMSKEYRDPIVTLIEPATKFYVAEEYHQDYFRLNPNAGYCRAVVANKVRKFNRTFGDKIKDSAK